jgi:uncharacterized repeat protein (TIGR01451 family)
MTWRLSRRSAVNRILIAALLTSPVAWAAPDLEVGKRVDVGVPAPGQPVEFTVDVRNVGADPAIDIHVRDRLPPGLEIPAGMAAFPSSGTYDPGSGDWAVGDLPGGAGATLSIPAIVSVPDPPVCIVNTAETAHDADPNAGNDRAMAAIRQPGLGTCVDVTVRFVDISAGPAICGTDGLLTVVIDVVNQGADAAQEVVVEIRQSPVIAPNLRFRHATCSGASCTLARLGPGQTVQLLAESDGFLNSQAQELRVTVTAASDGFDFAPDNNIAVRDVTLPDFADCDGDSSGGCFISNSTSGSSLERHLVTLRRFRDEHLRGNAPGRALIQLYERHSPALAKMIAGDERLRIAARALVAPLVMTVAYPWPALGVTAILVALPLGWRLRRRRTPTSRPADRD